MFHSARERGDRTEAHRLWVTIVAAELERVLGIARGFRNAALPGGRIPEADISDVAQDVFIRLHEKIDTLRGRSIGELRNFMRTATDFACRDYLHKHIQDDQRRAGSLDEDAATRRSTSNRALSDLAEQLAASDEEALIAREIIHPALALVDEDKRMVLVMDQQGYPTAEIMERLGIRRDAVYQRRKRGMKQLREAIQELAGEDVSA
jgi:RNA polymerase sigma factor (sigma-70 family)